jgi:hypothetical protein
LFRRSRIYDWTSSSILFTAFSISDAAVWRKRKEFHMNSFEMKRYYRATRK